MTAGESADPEVQLEIELPVKFDDDAKMPDISPGEPDEVWGQFFERTRPRPQKLRRWVLTLHNQKQHQQVIACLQQALLHGQARPWMYEVLAMSMELEDYPKESIERVVLSLSDFGAVDYGTMMYSGAYLAQFGRHDSAFRMYQQAARMLPERPEPYVMTLNMAPKLNDPESVSWAAAGVLTNYWAEDYPKLHQQAEDAVLELIRNAKKKGNIEAVESLNERLNSAKRRDISIKLQWNGSADLDMAIEEPNGTVCSFEQPQTTNGGILLHDGIGTDRQNAYEEYIAPQAFSGPYRVTMTLADGELVGDRALLTIHLNSGTPEEKRMTRTIVFNSDQASVSFELTSGRRQHPKTIVQADDRSFEGQLRKIAGANRFAARNANAQRVMQSFSESRGGQLQGGRRSGAFGFQPNVQLIQEGTSLTSRAVVSPDRRYVRIAIQPTFNNITDVFTFSFINGGGVGGN